MLQYGEIADLKEREPEDKPSLMVARLLGGVGEMNKGPASIPANTFTPYLKTMESHWGVLSREVHNRFYLQLPQNSVALFFLHPQWVFFL